MFIKRQALWAATTLALAGCGLGQKQSAPEVTVEAPAAPALTDDNGKDGKDGKDSEDSLDTRGLLMIVDQKYAEGKGSAGDTGVSIRRMRVWKRNPDSQFASDSTGDAPDFDQHTLELWFTIKGEKHTRYRKIAGLRVDGDGWLFPQEHLDNYLPHDAIETPYAYFERHADEAFILDESPSIVKYDRATNIVLDAQKNVVQEGVVSRIALDFGKSKLPAVRLLAFAPEANLLGGEGKRTIWVKNDRQSGGYALKGKMACVIETRNGGVSGNGGFNDVSMVYEDVELGSLIHNLKGDVQANPATDGEACDSPRCGSYDGMDPVADDELWIETTETYQIAGVNIRSADRTVKIIKTVSAPFYLNRELPIAFAGREPAISGIESLIRKCNDSAVQNAMSVSVNPLLGAVASTGVAPYSILSTIGFRLVANGRLDSDDGTAKSPLYVSGLSHYCDAMPDMKSPSAGLNSGYAALRKDQNGIVPGVTSCAMDIPRQRGIADEYAGKSLATVLDPYIVPGGWSGELARHTGAILVTSTAATDRPVYRTQTSGGATLH